MTSDKDGIGNITQYGYDAKYRLTSAKFSPVTNATYTYIYDAVDNRTFASENGASTFTYNAAGQIATSIAGTAVSTYTYDSDGNNTVVQTGTGFVTMVYDQENRMTVHQDGATLNTFTYEPNGMKHTEKLAAVTTTLVWNGSDYLQGRN